MRAVVDDESIRDVSGRGGKGDTKALDRRLNGHRYQASDMEQRLEALGEFSCDICACQKGHVCQISEESCVPSNLKIHVNLKEPRSPYS